MNETEHPDVQQDEQLAARMSQLSQWQPETDMERAWERVRSRVAHRRRMRVGAVGALGAVVLLAGGLLLSRGDDQALVVSEPDSEVPTAVPGEVLGDPVDLEALGDPGTHELGGWPLERGVAQSQELAVWIPGHEVLFVWGGVESDLATMSYTPLMQGAAFDLGARRWVRTAEAPFEVPVYPMAAAWDGSQVVVVGLDCGSPVSSLDLGRSMPECPGGMVAAGWDPTTNRWRELPAPPLALYTASAASAGGAVFVADTDSGALAALWDRAEESWSEASGVAPGEPAGEGPTRSSQYLACTGDSGTALVASDPTPGDHARHRVTGLDPVDAGWGEPIDLGSSVEFPVACHDDLAVFEVGTGPPTDPGPEGLPDPLMEVLDSSGLVVVDLRTREVTPFDDGATFGNAAALGNWLIVHGVDLDEVAADLDPSREDPNGGGPAPLPRTTARIAELRRNPDGTAAPLEFRQVASAPGVLVAEYETPLLGAWSGTSWFGGAIRGSATSTGPEVGFVAWVPPRSR